LAGSFTPPVPVLLLLAPPLPEELDALLDAPPLPELEPLVVPLLDPVEAPPLPELGPLVVPAPAPPPP
jgi:hypothetical protein